MLGIRKRLRKLVDLPTHLLTAPNEQAVVFVHIPKCGGTTINDITFHNYNSWRVLEMIVSGRRAPDGSALSFESEDAPDNLKISEKLAGPFRKVECILGHVPYGVHQLLDRSCFYFTFLRNPVDRVWSQFNHLLNTPNHYLYPIAAKHDFNLAKILNSSEIFEFCNDQARMLLGTKKIDMGPEDIERAIEQAERRYGYIGTIERFGTCLHELGAILNWKFLDYQKKNVSVYRRVPNAPGEELIEIIKKKNQVDMALYEHLVRRLQGELSLGPRCSIL